MGLSGRPSFGCTSPFPSPFLWSHSSWRIITTRIRTPERILRCCSPLACTSRPRSALCTSSSWSSFTRSSGGRCGWRAWWRPMPSSMSPIRSPSSWFSLWQRFGCPWSLCVGVKLTVVLLVVAEQDPADCHLERCVQLRLLPTSGLLSRLLWEHSLVSSFLHDNLPDSWCVGSLHVFHVQYIVSIPPPRLSFSVCLTMSLIFFFLVTTESGWYWNPKRKIPKGVMAEKPKWEILRPSRFPTPRQPKIRMTPLTSFWFQLLQTRNRQDKTFVLLPSLAFIVGQRDFLLAWVIGLRQPRASNLIIRSLRLGQSSTLNPTKATIARLCARSPLECACWRKEINKKKIKRKEIK